jgi:hypothetical protein
MMMKRLNETGYVLVFTTLMLTLLLFFVGFATDGGRAYLLRAELTRTVDAAAVAAASQISQGLTAARAAACDSARMNGLSDCTKLTVTKVVAYDASGNPRDSVQVIGVTVTPTIFTRAGKFFGCGTSCDSINVAARAVASGGGTIDLVVNLDNTSSMGQNGGAKLTAAKNGANALVDALFPSGGSSTAMVSMVPFQGCYANSNSDDCIDQDEYPANGGMIVSLTNNTTNLKGAINQLVGKGGSGTNVCTGLKRARQRLFQSGVARPNSARYLIILTDSESTFTNNPSGSVDLSCFPNPAKTSDNAIQLAMGVQAYNVVAQIKDPTFSADG